MGIDEEISCSTCRARLGFFYVAGFAEELPESPRMGLAQPSVRVAARNRPLPKKRTSWIDNSLFGGLIATHAADWASTEQCLRTSQEQEKAGFVGLCHEGLLPTALVESKVGLGAYEATTAGLEVYSQYVLTKAPSRAHCPHRPTRQYSGHCVCGGTQLPYDPARQHTRRGEPLMRLQPVQALALLLAQQSARHY